LQIITGTSAVGAGNAGDAAVSLSNFFGAKGANLSEVWEKVIMIFENLIRFVQN